MEPLSMGVGEQIQSWCTRCRRMCEHVVAEVDRDRPVRVNCASCHGEHLYRAQPPRARTGVAARTPPTESADWEDLMAVADLGKVQPYAMRRDFSAGDVLNHRVFGLGIVVREVEGGKIRVSFQDGVRLLVCSRRH